MNRHLRFFAASLHSSRFIPLVMMVIVIALTLTNIPKSAVGPQTLNNTVSGPAGVRKNFPVLSRKEGNSTQAQATESFGKLPLSFESNQGQAESRVKFISRGHGHALFLTSTEVVLALQDKEGEGNTFRETESSLFKMMFIGANSAPVIEGQGELPGKSNYIIGNDPENWQTEIPNYQKVRYQEVYPGVDLVFYGNQQHLEYDFVVAPGYDARAINLAFEGARNISIDGGGDLVINTPAGEIRQHKPFAYQEFNGAKNEVDVRFALREAHEVGFEIGDYDAQRPLVIDPVIVYSSLLGGTNNDNALAIAVDASGNIYVAGPTGSSDFPSTGQPFPNNAFISGYITKFDPTGKNIIYSTYLGGNNFDVITSLALDASGNAYVTGWTTSTDFPTTPGAYQSAYKGGGLFGEVIFGGDGFIVKLNASGNSLLYSTLLGGSLADNFNNIAVDSQGNAYVAGYAWSIDFPSTPGAYQTVNHASPFYAPYANNFNEDAFVSKINANGTALLYSTFIGGASGEFLRDMKLDSANNVILVGNTLSGDYPTTPGAYGTPLGNGNSFVYVTKLNSTGSALVSSTIVGAGVGRGVALDTSGNVYITGNAIGDYPTTPGVVQPEPSPLNDGSVDAFVTKLNPGLSQVIYSTFLGGGGHDFGIKIEVDSAGDAYVTGTATFAFPITANAFQPVYGEGGDAFLTKLNPTATALLYSTYLGGRDTDQANALALDSKGNAYIAGIAFSSDFPTTPGSFRPTHPLFDIDAFFAKFGFSQFELCIQDESNGNILQVNATTGDYQFTNCGGLTIGGTGTLTKRGSLITLQHNASDRRVLTSIDTSTNKATASIQLLSQGRMFGITDRNITNNTCACR